MSGQTENKQTNKQTDILMTILSAPHGTAWRFIRECTLDKPTGLFVVLKPKLSDSNMTSFVIGLRSA